MTGNELALMWAARQRRRAERAELERLVQEVKDLQPLLHEMQAAAAKARRQLMRQDGPRGFVMIEKEHRR